MNNSQRPFSASLTLLGALAAHAVAGAPVNDLAPLSDEFSHVGAIQAWSNLDAVEQWFAPHLESLDIDLANQGEMTLVPFTTSWYADYRGPLIFKSVSGDFVFTTRVAVSGRDGVSVPQSLYSLAGPFIRAPRGVTPATWTTGGENYVFLSLGHADSNPPTWHHEIKTTEDSQSTLFVTNAAGPIASLQIARLGDAVICLRRAPGQSWQVHGRFHRDDFPTTLQVGLVTYTDWLKCEIFDPFVLNSITVAPPLPDGVVDPNPFIPFTPDLIARFDFARFARPEVPPELAGLDLSDPAQVPDAALLAFLGDNANSPAPPCPGDTNGDRVVDFADLNAVVGQFNAAGVGLFADLDDSDTVDFADLNLVLSSYNAPCD